MMSGPESSFCIWANRRQNVFRLSIVWPLHSVAFSRKMREISVKMEHTYFFFDPRILMLRSQVEGCYETEAKAFKKAVEILVSSCSVLRI